MKKCITLLSVVFILLSMLAPLTAQTEEEKLINSYWLTNRILIVGYGEMAMDMVAAINTEKGIVIIDSGMSPSLTAKHRSIIEKEFGRSDFKYLINTHAHGDHTMGNQVFKDAEIIAHQNIVKRMKEDADEDVIKADIKRTRKRNELRNRLKKTLKKDSKIYKKLRDRIYLSGKMCDDYETIYQLTLPDITFTDKLTLDMGDMKIEVFYFGPDFHSDNDIIISIPKENVVFTGDIIFPNDRYQRVNSKSDIGRWIDCLDKIVNSNNELKSVVAYHVGVLPGKDLNVFHDSLKTMRNEQLQKKSAVVRLKELIVASNVQEALDKFEDQFLKNSKKNYFIWEGDLLSLATEYRQKEKYDEAILILKMYEEIFPHSTRPLYFQAVIFTQKGKNHLAVEALRKMRKIDPTNHYYAEMIFQLENR